MPVLPFDDWLPDQGLMANSLIANVVPAASGYQPVPSPVPLQRESLPDGFTNWYPVKYLQTHYTTAGNAVPLVGVEDGMGYWDSAGVLQILDGGVRAATGWHLYYVVQWGDFIYYVDGVNPIYKADLEDPGSGAPVPDLPTGLGFHYLVECRNFLVGADEVHTGGISNPYSVRWSGINRPDEWPEPGTPDAVAWQSDQQNINGRGIIKGLTGGQFLTILTENAVVRGDYVGPPFIFEFQTVDFNVGCRASRSVIKVGNTTYFYSNAGWRATNGGETVAIGEGQIDDWFARNMKETAYDRMVPAFLSSLNCVAWLIETNDTADEKPDCILLFSRARKRWSPVRLNLHFIGSTAMAAVSFDNMPWAEMSIDDPSIPSPDSAIFKGSYTAPSAVDLDGANLTFAGDPMPATLETKEIGNYADRFPLRQAVPLMDGGGTVTVQQVLREHALDGNARLGRVRQLNRQGFIPLHDAGRGQRLRAQITGQWSHWRGFEVS